MKKIFIIIGIIVIGTLAFCADFKESRMEYITKGEVQTFFHASPKGSVWSITDYTGATIILKNKGMGVMEVTIVENGKETSHYFKAGHELEPIFLKQAAANYNY